MCPREDRILHFLIFVSIGVPIEDGLYFLYVSKASFQ